MIRILNASGLTAVPSDMTLPVGYQWKLRYAVLLIIVGGTAGFRKVQLSQKPFGNSQGLILALCPGISTTDSTSGDTLATAGGLSNLGVNGTVTGYATWNVEPVLNPGDTLSFNYTALVTGDTLSYWISLEEISVADGLD